MEPKRFAPIVASLRFPFSPDSIAQVFLTEWAAAEYGMIWGKSEGKGPSRYGERRWPKARRMR